MTIIEIAKLAESSLPQFESQLKALKILGKRDYDQGLSPCKVIQPCEGFIEKDVFHGIREVLRQLDTKGSIYLSEPEPIPTADSAVARYGDLSLTFWVAPDIREFRNNLSIVCWYYPA